jgi:hypothetical protein
MNKHSPRPSLEEVRMQATHYPTFLTNNKKDHPKEASKSLRCHTSDEELAFVQLMRIMGNLGHDNTKIEALEVIDEYINHRVNKHERVKVLDKILVCGLLNCHKDLV